MTEQEKMEALREMLKPDTVSDSELTTLLTISKGAILNRRYPFGYGEHTEVPTKYEYVQLQACVQLYNKKGVEAQTSHSENGISRTYESGDISVILLSQIVPMAGSVYEES